MSCYHDTSQYVSFLSVCGNLALALLTATMAFRIYKSVLKAVNKSGDGHPFRVGITEILSVIKLYFRLNWSLRYF